MSIVEDTLRSQHEVWAEICGRVSRISTRELTPEAPKRILMFGLGSSHFAARLSAYALTRDKTRQRIPVISCSSMSIGPEIIPMKGDWAMAFTHRGKSRATLKALEIAEQMGAFTIAITAQGIEEVRNARYVLQSSPLERCEPHTAGVTGSICAATTLLLGQKAADEWDALRMLPDPNLDMYRDRAKMGPTMLLGEWEGEWLAREAALKMMEMARLPVRVFGSEEFFHGPKMSLQENDSIWHIALPRDSRTPEIPAALRVELAGGSPLAFLPPLVELQWLSLAVALNRAVDPDGV